jgi:hypothetical protein
MESPEDAVSSQQNTSQQSTPQQNTPQQNTDGRDNPLSLWDFWMGFIIVFVCDLIVDVVAFSATDALVQKYPAHFAGSIFGICSRIGAPSGKYLRKKLAHRFKIPESAVV